MLPFIKSTYFNDLLDSYSNGVIIFNVAGRAYAVNEAAIRIFGMERGELLERALPMIADTLGMRRSFAELVAGIEENPEDHAGASARFARPDGTVRYLNFTRSQLVDHGKVFGIIIEVADVTAIYEFHAREKIGLEEKHQLARDRAKGLERFSSAVAHQIRNPLLVIGGFAERLRRTLPQDDAREQGYVDAILDSARRLELVVRAVSDFSAIALGPREPVTLADLAWPARELAALRLPERASGAIWSLPEGGPLLRVDAALFRKGLAELFVNSLEASNGRAEVSLQSRDANGELQLLIEDCGPGFRDEDLPFVFDPFFTTKAVGVGMGLCMAQRIFREHGHELAVERPAPGQGARLHITVPKTSL